MAFQPTPAHSKRLKLKIPLPVDNQGRPVLDEDDKPIEGLTAAVMELPRWSYVPRPLMRKILDQIDEINNRPVTTSQEEVDRQYEVALIQFREFVSDDIYALLEGLVLGELNQLAKQWTLESEMPLPELLASYSSSKSTRRPSTSTSTSSVGVASTT